jgi:hypothetical protein
MVTIVITAKDLASKVLTKLVASFTGLRTAINKAFQYAAIALPGLVVGLQKFAAAGEKDINVTRRFRDAMSEVGQSATIVVDRLKAATQGLVEESEVMRLATVAMRDGGLSLSQTALAMEFLTKHAISMGQSVQEVLEPALTGLIRGNLRPLLAIFPDLGRVIQELGEDGFKDASQKAEILSMGLSRMAGKLPSLSASTKDAAIGAQQLGTRFRDLWNDMQVAVAQSPATTAAFTSLEQAMVAFKDAIPAVMATVNKLIAILGPATNGLVWVIDKAATGWKLFLEAVEGSDIGATAAATLVATAKNFDEANRVIARRMESLQEKFNKGKLTVWEFTEAMEKAARELHIFDTPGEQAQLADVFRQFVGVDPKDLEQYTVEQLQGIARLIEVFGRENFGKAGLALKFDPLRERVRNAILDRQAKDRADAALQGRPESRKPKPEAGAPGAVPTPAAPRNAAAGIEALKDELALLRAEFALGEISQAEFEQGLRDVMSVGEGLRRTTTLSAEDFTKLTEVFMEVKGEVMGFAEATAEATQKMIDQREESRQSTVEQVLASIELRMENIALLKEEVEAGRASESALRQAAMQAEEAGLQAEAALRAVLPVGAELDAVLAKLAKRLQELQGLTKTFGERLREALTGEAEGEERSFSEKLQDQAVSAAATFKETFVTRFEEAKEAARELRVEHKRTMESLNKQLKAGEISLEQYREASAKAMGEFQEASKAAGGAFKQAMMGALAEVAAGFGRFFLAQAIAEVAKAIANPLKAGPHLAAAAGYTAAALAMFAVAGAMKTAAGGRSAGGGGSGGAADTADTARLGEEKDAILIIEGGFINVNDPRQADQLANALSQLSGRRVTTIVRAPSWGGVR